MTAGWMTPPKFGGGVGRCVESTDVVARWHELAAITDGEVKKVRP
ncbi:MAG TPA: hypothetical protein VK762_32100 [Polyangiaceae bacterium]|nr:hypothetical protein [Polyangiaceae bacterium]